MDTNRHNITSWMVVFVTVVMLARLSDLVSLPVSLLTGSGGRHGEFFDTVLLYTLDTLCYLWIKSLNSTF